MRVTSRIVALAAISLVALGMPAHAAPSVFTMNPNPLDVGNVVVGQTGTATGTLSDNNNDHVDLVVTNNCTGGGGGTFTVSPNNSLDLKDPVTITATYQPSARGQRRCRVDIYKQGSSSPSGSFDVRGTGQDPPKLNVTGATTFTAVRFNDAAPAHTSQQTYTVTNQGDLDLVINSVTVTGTNAPDFTLLSSALPGPIPRNNTASWTVVFNPSAAGTRTAMLTFSSNDPSTPSRVLNLQGDGQTGIISVNDRAFGTVNVGSQSTLDITVTNNGGTPKGRLGVTTATIAGGSWFTFSACGGGVACTFSPALSIQTTAAVGVRCSPPTTANPNDTQTATVTFTSDTDDAAANPDRVASLSCTAGKGALETSSAAVAFTSQLIMTAATPQMLTVKNAGNAPTTFYLSLTGAGAPSYSATVMGKTCGTSSNNTCPLAIGTMETVVVTFTPGTEADIVAGLDVVSPATPFPQLTLAGRGIDRHIAIAPTVSFPDTFRNPGDKATVMPVAVQNVGEYPLHVSNLEVLGPGWELAETTTTFDVPGLGSRDVKVKFAPETAGKAPTGTLVVTSDDRTNGTMMVMLSGNGKDRRVQLAPAAIDLGDTGAGVPTRLSVLHPDGLLTIQNHDGDNAFTIHSIEIEGDAVFQVEGVSTGDDLPASGTKTFDIVFAPPGIGEFDATAVLYLDQDPTPQVSVPLHGRSLFVDAHGGGGCNAGGSSGGRASLVLVLGAFLLARRRRLAALVGGIAALPLTSSAEPTRNLQLSVFDPTPSTTEAPLQLVPATVGPRGELALTVLASYASNPLVLGTVQADDQVVRTQLMTRIGVAYAFAKRFEAGLAMPFYSQSGDALEAGQLGSPPASGTARGDLALHLKAAAVTTPRFALGVLLAGTAPTSSDGQFTGSDTFSGRGFVLATFAPSSHLSVHVNAGAVLRPKATFANIEQKSGAAGGAGLSLRMIDSITLGGEVFGTRTAGAYHGAPDPGATMGPTEALTTIEALASARLQLGRVFSLTVGAGRGVTSSVGSPDLRGVVVLAYVPTAKATPKPRAATEPVVTTDPSQRDSDRDRVPDATDKCPNDPEDRDRFEDDDGCPDLDNDKDGVPDATDQCPEPEDRDGFEDTDGCIDPDNDKDGVLDANDKCPNEAETINGMADNDGCPDTGAPLVMQTPERLELVEAIAFKGSTITDVSTNVLSQLGATLRARTDILKIRITAHVQPGKSARTDLKLSEARAKAVKEWLVHFGIDPTRLDVRGMGGTKPLVSPKSKGAALVNDRVEFLIIDRG